MLDYLKAKWAAFVAWLKSLVSRGGGPGEEGPP